MQHEDCWKVLIFRQHAQIVDKTPFHKTINQCLKFYKNQRNFSKPQLVRNFQEQNFQKLAATCRMKNDSNVTMQVMTQHQFDAEQSKLGQMFVQ